jgi:pimeloyl-ACP methyl ester carboxylesterase
MHLHATAHLEPDGSDAILLLHGFGTNAVLTWWSSGWIAALERDRHPWVAPDLPGHGGSDKPHDPAAYRPDRIIAGIDRLLDEHELDAVALLGYSLGGELALRYAAARPERVRRVVAGGVGTTPLTDREPALAWWLAARTHGNDLRALRALAAGLTATNLTRYPGPALLFSGAGDELARGSDRLAAAMRNAEHVVIDGRDHLTTLSARRLKERVSAFLRPAVNTERTTR